MGRTPILFRNNTYTLRLNELGPAYLPAESQPHDARPFLPWFHAEHLLLFLAPSVLACYMLIYVVLPLVSPSCLYHVTLALESQKLSLLILCQCIRYRKKNCALVRFRLANVVTNRIR